MPLVSHGPGSRLSIPLDGLFLRLQRNNILYLLSAVLMLLGCYLVCVPYLITLKREVGGLLVLLGTINLYEVGASHAVLCEFRGTGPACAAGERSPIHRSA